MLGASQETAAGAKASRLPASPKVSNVSDIGKGMKGIRLGGAAGFAPKVGLISLFNILSRSGVKGAGT